MADHTIHSTGRGGAGNIGADPNTTYLDGDIVREGVAGVSDRAEYSSGRGGAGNMVGAPRTGTPVSKSADVIPETATRTAEGHENFHTGRGGQGNVHMDRFGGHSTREEQDAAHEGKKEGLAEKVKHAIGLDGHKKKAEGESGLTK